MALTGRTAHAVYGELARPEGDLPDRQGSSWPSLMVITADLFEHNLTAFEDGEDTAEHLQRIGFRLAVASSSPSARLDLSLRVTGLAHMFEATVAGDQVASGKPAPDIYLAAAGRAKRQSHRTVRQWRTVPAGIASAKAAGMKVVAVDRGFFDSDALSEADLMVPRLTPAVVPRLRELSWIVGSLCSDDGFHTCPGRRQDR